MVNGGDVLKIITNMSGVYKKYANSSDLLTLSGSISGGIGDVEYHFNWIQERHTNVCRSHTLSNCFVARRYDGHCTQ